MSIRTTLQNVSSKNQVDSLARVVHELRELQRSMTNQLNVVINLSGSGLAQETSLQALVTATSNYGNLENWDKIVGNSVVYTWGTGSLGGQICTLIEYKTAGNTIFTQTLVYNSNEKVTSITTS